MNADLSIEPAVAADVPELTALVNSAYRGETSKKGWTTEADLLDGIRIDEENLNSILRQPQSVILKCINNNKIVGCVHLQKSGAALYLGMLTVSPLLQGAGIGKALLNAAEEHARRQNCTHVVMSVISVRHELIQWYERRGYKMTGERKPFPADPRFGIPKQQLEFVVLQKNLAE